MCRYMGRWPKLVHKLIKPLRNTRKIVKLCANVYEHGCGCVNVNVVDFASVNGNVAGCVDVYEKFFTSIDKAKWLCYNGLTK